MKLSRRSPMSLPSSTQPRLTSAREPKYFPRCKMNPRLKVAIIIVSHNTRDLLVDCVSSVIESAQGENVEIVVVDNASSDGSYEAVFRYYPQVNAINNKVNIGFGAACNQAIRATIAPFVLLLNSDARLTPQALSALCGCMQLNDRCGAAGCTMVNPRGAEIVCARNFLMPFNQALELAGLSNVLPSRYLRRTSRLRFAENLVDCSVDWVEGACLILRRAALDQVGLFDERFFMYSEDEDLCARLRQRGWSVCFSAGGTAIHHGGASTRQNRVEMLGHFYSSQLLFLSKHNGVTALSLYMASMSIVLMLRRFLLPLVLRSEAAGEAAEELFALRRAWSSRSQRG